MFGLGFTELVIILLIVLILFGGKKIPQLGAGLGEGIRNFSRSLRGDAEQEPDKLAKTESPAPKNSAAPEEAHNSRK